MKGKIEPGKQRRLWEEQGINPVPALKLAMNEAIKASDLSREQVVDDINRRARLAGIRQRASLAMMNKWLNEVADGYIIPLPLLSPFCQAVKENSPLEAYARAFPGARVINEEDFKLLQWAKSEKEARKAKKAARQWAQKIGIE